MDFWILTTNFVTPCKIHGYGFSFYNVLVLCVWNFGMLDELYLKNLRSIEWMECDFNLLCYQLFKFPKTITLHVIQNATVSLNSFQFSLQQKCPCTPSDFFVWHLKGTIWTLLLYTCNIRGQHADSLWLCL
jgi:hypothetical protein